MRGPSPPRGGGRVSARRRRGTSHHPARERPPLLPTSPATPRSWKTTSIDATPGRQIWGWGWSVAVAGEGRRESPSSPRSIPPPCAPFARVAGTPHHGLLHLHIPHPVSGRFSRTNLRQWAPHPWPAIGRGRRLMGNKRFAALASLFSRALTTVSLTTAPLPAPSHPAPGLPTPALPSAKSPARLIWQQTKNTKRSTWASPTSSGPRPARLHPWRRCPWPWRGPPWPPSCWWPSPRPSTPGPASTTTWPR